MNAILLPTSSVAQPGGPAWRNGPQQWGLLALGLAALVACHWAGLVFMVATWQGVEEYSYGWFVPLISIFLVWQRSDELRRLELQGSWWGLPLVALSLLLAAVGHFSAIRSISQYGFVLGLVGLSLGCVGAQGTRLIRMALVVLLFMVPLPQFVLRELSHGLQLLSSQLGVALIRQFGISVFLEGNVIDLGSYKLQVVEACNGLRYLFPLMVLGFLGAYFYRGPWWQRLVIVASTIPLTIAINSLRIGLIGVTVEYWGAQMAEGLLHDLEGWFMFMVCLALLIGEMALLARLDPQRRGLGGLLALEIPAPAPPGAALQLRRTGAASLVVLALLGGAAALALATPEQQLRKPARQAFTEFPLSLPGGWLGRPDRIAPDILAVLAVDDYFIANYARPSAPWVNFYTAYYASQSGGQSSHSPRTCIPGDGWAILSIEPVTIALESGASMQVNQAVIQKGELRQLVYYWFQQRGQVMTGEYEVKWGILRDAMLHDRSDGALIRLVTPVLAQEGQAAAEQRLSDFLRSLQPRLRAFIPD